MVGGGRKKVNKCYPEKDSSIIDDTQPVDTQISPQSLPGEDHELYNDQNMAPADDHPFFNDAFETQLVNLCGENQILEIGGETQVVDFGDETQVVDFGGETQVVDFGSETQQVDLGVETQLVEDHDGLQNKHIQTFGNCNIEVAVDSDSEGSDRTEVLCDTQELSDDDSMENSYSSIDQVKLPKSSNSNTSDRSSLAQSDVQSNDKHHSGSLQRGFTSIRAASIRASGLAAYDMSRKGTKGSTWSIKSDNPLEQEGAGHNGTSVVGPQSEVRKELNLNACEEYDEHLKEVGNENRCKVGSSAARKLFRDEILIETKGPEDGKYDFQKAVDLPQLASENVLAGLSYLDSQEPGEDTQANALEAVDKFLNLNPFDFDQHIDFGKSSIGKSKCVSAANGTKHLARRAAGIADAEGGIFDWDDNREDEGGGEFFQKKKELLFGRIPATEPLKHGSLDPLRRGAKSCGEKEKHPLNNKKFKGSPCSDSRLMSSKGRVKSELSKSRTRKNFVEELDEQFTVGAGDGMVADGNGDNVPDLLNVGLDTQMAAEAMEILCFGVPVLENGCRNENKGDKTLRNSSCKGRVDDESLLKQRSSNKKTRSSDTRPATRLSVQKDAKLVEEHCRETVKQQKSSKKQGNEEQGAGLRMIKANMTKSHASRGKEEELGQEERPPKESRGSTSAKNCHLQQQHGSFTPVAHRTRHNLAESQPKSSLSAAATFNRNGTDSDACETLMNHGNFAANQTANLRNMKSSWGELCAVDHPKRKRSHRKMPTMGQEATTQSCRRSKRLRGDQTSTLIDVSTKKRKCSPECTSPGIASSRRGSRKKPLNEGIDKGHPEGTNINDAFADGNTKALLNKSPEDFNRKADVETTQFVDEAHGAESSTGDQCKAPASACTTPTNSRILKNSVSPICMGDEYQKQSCRKNMSRKRREMTNVRVLFSQHLDADIIKQQKKILARLGASSASSMSDATHFVADEFVRTRNMLEAIAVGKPVVTHLWLESCGQANCLIDEKSYILRDARKEKEFGFSMPISLARACQHPILQGYKVFITPNTKPGKEILASLVKAVHGLAVERLCRSAMKEEIIPDNFLVLSCEEDYEVCILFLEKGATVYSSELLLNGIVTQRLEFDRYRLFTDHVKRTRSTVWVKKNNNQYLAVAKCK
ncbi:uncharacterized protein LOC129887238 isoform X2 [Solanum dulcamara]|uniref:uncharacterized protein LOC129887238 isoform X2 n=1 Tax=Solanum dulcamara TaxID=45834 RepID=UPI00248697B1|nr:uncharacterized protein LOC129887238 isoform X2 [Solanum dulcamara]